MKLKIILLSVLASATMVVSTSAAANGISIGWIPGGHVSYTITVGQPYSHAPQHWHRGHRHTNHHRQWRPAKRYHRGHRGHRGERRHYRNDRRIYNRHGHNSYCPRRPHRH